MVQCVRLWEIGHLLKRSQSPVTFYPVDCITVGGARALVEWLELPARKVGDRGCEPHSRLQVLMKQNVYSRSLVRIQYNCGEPSWPRGSVLDRLKFRILCLEGSVIYSSHHSFIHSFIYSFIHSFIHSLITVGLSDLTRVCSIVMNVYWQTQWCISVFK